MSKVIVLGASTAIDMNNVGGTESLVRRFVNCFKAGEVKVFLVGPAHENQPDYVMQFPQIEDALKAIQDNGEGNEQLSVIKMYLSVKDRLKLIKFRRRNKHINFHAILTSWSPKTLKKFSLNLDAFLYRYNGQIFAVSERQKRWLQRFFKRVSVVYPPVSDCFFTEEKKKVERKFLFIGRLDKSKGIDVTIELFEWLAANYECHTKIVGIMFKGSEYSKGIHEKLQNHDSIEYKYNERENFDESLELNTAREMQQYTYFLQPYNNVYGTIDSPLLVLEAMAANCIIFSSNDSNIRNLYGESLTLIENNEDKIENYKKIISQLIENESSAEEELERIRKRVTEINVRPDLFAENIIKYL